MRPVKPSRATTTRGFTAPVTLVAVSLIAAMAVVGVPTVAAQLGKGDANRVGEDVSAIRGAVEQFLTDVQSYPGTIEQTASRITTAQVPLVAAAQRTYVSSEASRWKGPYLKTDSIGRARTGFGWTFKPAFEVDTLLPSGAASARGGQRYMVLKAVVPARDSSSVLQLDRRFDDGNPTTGTIRYRKAETDTVKFLILPIA
jgi:type II secretory pathway pseudopilin PulG